MGLNASKLAKMRMKASYLSAGWSSVSEQEALRPQLPHHTDIAPDAAADDDDGDGDDDDDYYYTLFAVGLWVILTFQVSSFRHASLAAFLIRKMQLQSEYWPALNYHPAPWSIRCFPPVVDPLFPSGMCKLLSLWLCLRSRSALEKQKLAGWTRLTDLSFIAVLLCISEMLPVMLEVF